jgi:hypothetical protein
VLVFSACMLLLAVTTLNRQVRQARPAGAPDAPDTR